MKRVIEDLIEKRKKAQRNLKDSFRDLSELFKSRSIFNKREREIETTLEKVSNNICDLIEIQDREWDAQSNNHNTTVLNSIKWKLDKLEAENSNLKKLVSKFGQLELRLGTLIKNSASEESREELSEIKEKLSPFQYSDFEMRFRGSEESIKDKLEQYVHFYKGSSDVLDIGCGRGEFLEMLKSEGISSRGVDLSDSMLQEAESKGLECVKADVLTYLRDQEPESLGGIFSSQVIEHLQTEDLQEIILHSHRVLKEGSTIILETVNPLSIFALSRIFFLDITHNKPLLPEYMRYMLESAGFDNVEIIYSSENKEKLLEVPADTPGAHEINTNTDRLNSLIYGPSIYAVKGIKR